MNEVNFCLPNVAILIFWFLRLCLTNAGGGEHCSSQGLGFLNKERLTPRELFTKNHKDMRKDGEQWMKETTTSCTVVGTLIVTIMFATVITVLGGNDQNNGFLIFLNKKLLKIFLFIFSIYFKGKYIFLFWESMQTTSFESMQNNILGKHANNILAINNFLFKKIGKPLFWSLPPG